jgi:hypothetical protein
MSKKSRRRNKVLLAGAALLGASKLGMLGGKTAAGITGDKMATARKAMTSNDAMRGKNLLPKAKPEIVKKVPGKIVKKDVLQSGPFKMFGVKTDNKFSQESIDKFKAANKKQIERRAKLKMGKSNTSDSPGFFGMRFDKPLFNKGKMVKARGGGMARTKPTKLS